MTALSSTTLHDLEQYLTAPVLRALRKPEPTTQAVAQAYTQLEDTLTTLTSFVPSPVLTVVAKSYCERVEGQYLRGTVVRVALSGFAALSAQLAQVGRRGNEELSAIVGDVFTALLDEVYAHGGGIITFGGDTLTAFFDAAQLGFRHPALACAAALGMQRHMAAWVNASTSHGTLELQTRIGVHSGSLFVAGVGNDDHAELVVAGRMINRAITAQESAAPGEVVIESATLERLAGAQTHHKLGDFHLLHSFAFDQQSVVIPQTSWTSETPSLAAIERLLQRIRLLRPYTPHNLLERLTAMQTQAGEFRPVTVLFDDFSALSKLMSFLELPALVEEDVTIIERVLNTYYAQTQATIHQYGGTISKVDTSVYGNRIMALFGAPIAHEDDPERAARAALELQADLDGVNRAISTLLQHWAAEHKEQQLLLRMRGGALRRRIGLASGTLFAGIVGTPQRRDYTVIGHTVDVAAKLMAVAQTGETLLAAATYRAVQSVLDVQPRPSLTLSDEQKSVPVFRVLGEWAAADEAEHTSRKTPLVGRQNELEQFLDAALRVFAPQPAGQIIAMIGEPGIGKSRLADEALDTLRARQEDIVLVREACQSYQHSVPYAVVARLARQLLHLPSDSVLAAAELQQQLDTLVPHWSRFAPILAALLNLPLPESSLTTNLSAEQRNERLQELIIGLCLALAQQQPLAVVIDDLHWADRSSQTLVQQLAQELAEQPMLLALLYRPVPEIAEPWREIANCTVIAMEELSQDDSEALVSAMLDGTLPAELQPLIERTHGSPFFLEEMLTYLLQTKALQRDQQQHWILTVPLDSNAIPSRVEQFIIARLDRLDETSRAVAQTAAVLGHYISEQLLTITAQHDGMQDVQLEALLREGLIVPDGAPATYRFKHALVRDVVYESLLFARRRELHARVAAAIAQEYAEQLDAYRVVLAQHYLSADQHERAFPHFLQAAQQAQARYANQEALALYQQAIATAAWRQRAFMPADYDPAITIYEHMGDVYSLTGDYPAARNAYEWLLGLLTAGGDAYAVERAAVQRKIGSTFEQQGNAETALRWLDDAATTISAATPNDDTRLEQARIGSDTGWVHFRQNDLERAQQQLEQALAAVQAADAEQARILNRLGGVAWTRGDLALARQHVERSLAASERSGSLVGQAEALSNLGVLAESQGDLDESINYSKQSLDIREQIGSRRGLAIAAINLGVALYSNEQYQHAYEYFTKALEWAVSTRDAYHQMLALLNLGRIQVELQQWQEAERVIHHCQFIAAQLDVSRVQLDCCVHLAEIALGYSNSTIALQEYQQALSLATDTDNDDYGRIQRLEAKIALAQGDTDRAEELLQAAEALFTRLHNVPEARRTRKLLDEVRGEGA